MPLPAPSIERKLHHTRTITCLGYERADGLWDIDGWLTDVKTAGYPNPDRGEIPAGEPLHGMGIRLTIDATLTILYAVAVTDFSPFRICPEVTPNFAKLAGLRLTTGFNRAARVVVGGTAGCTHLVELLGPMATTAFQTLTALRWKPEGGGLSEGGRPPQGLLNSCHGWSSDGEVVRREFPEQYTGAGPSTAATL